MARGGRRPGAGRKPGAVTKRTREIADRITAEGTTPLEILTDMMLGTLAFDDAKFKCAVAAAPYVHPRLTATELTGKDGAPLVSPAINVTVGTGHDRPAPAHKAGNGSTHPGN